MCGRSRLHPEIRTEHRKRGLDGTENLNSGDYCGVAIFIKPIKHFLLYKHFINSIKIFYWPIRRIGGSGVLAE